MKKTIIIGIGQHLRGDDAVGVRVVEEWAARHPKTLSSSHVEVALIPLPGLALLDQITGFEYAILVDAVLGGQGVSPGSLLYLSPEDLSSFSRGTGSAHGWGVAESLALAKTLKIEGLPAAIRILGIGGKQVEVGAGLSPEVQAAIPGAVSALSSLVFARQEPTS
jgi:hydrogenase maturation protease